ncbi:YceI family protein [Winogradskyella maritima]|uniref:YceI family protein n=1 Tax=Winogradskyella maritima TaxID=1517766 RepID=A0ABV8AMT6_9FLAO|nr:YceI family protein [Winogradskyella maritima]
MKTLLYCLTFLCSLSVIDAQTNSDETTKTYTLNLDKSVINWRGYYLFQVGEHKGTVNFSKGELTAKNGKITGGRFTIDMTSITNPDYEKSGNGPVAHLKNADFFDVETHHTANLVITKVVYHPNENLHQCFADLTIKGVTLQTEFWANANSKTKTMTTDFKIDRTRWGIVYNNKAKDHAISDGIDFNVILKFD